MISVFTAEEQGDIRCYLYAIQNAVPAKRLRNGWMRVAQNIRFRDIKTDNPTAEELKAWWEKSGLPLKRFFNTSGNIYKEMKLKDKLPEMSEGRAACTSCNRRNACETTNPCWRR